MNSPSVKKTEKRKRWQNKQNKVFFSSSLSSLRGHRTMYFFVEIVKKKDPSKGSFCWSPLFHFTAKKKCPITINPLLHCSQVCTQNYNIFRFEESLPVLFYFHDFHQRPLGWRTNFGCLCQRVSSSSS